MFLFFLTILVFLESIDIKKEGFILDYYKVEVKTLCNRKFYAVIDIHENVHAFCYTHNMANRIKKLLNYQNVINKPPK